jgi:hypothetical protein
VALGRDHHQSDRGTHDRGQQQYERQHLPAQPGARGGEELEVAIAHALLAGQQPEELEHEPQERIAAGSPEDRVLRAGGQGQDAGRVMGQAGQQSDPQQRQGQQVGQ